MAISSGLGTEQITNMTKFDKYGHTIYEKYQLLEGYSPSALAVESKDETKNEYYLFHHNKQKLPTSTADQNVTTFKDKGQFIKSFNVQKRIYKRISMIPLANGKIFIAGIIPIAVHGDKTTVEVNIYNPTTNKIENGYSFYSYGIPISCFEQKENEVYCAYSYVDNFVTSLSLKYFKIKSDGVTIEDVNSINLEHWHTFMNFIKGIPISQNEAAILIQIGDGEVNTEIPFGNSGKNLFFFHIQTEEGNIQVKRMELLSNSCSYTAENVKEEFYNADIIALSDKRIIAVCESGENKFQGFSISIGKKHIDRFEFTPRDAMYAKNPALAKFGKNAGFFYTYIPNNFNSKVVFSFVDYPDCEDYSKTPILLPRKLHLKLSLDKNVYMGNPYSDESNEEIIKVRITNSHNTMVYNADKKEEILENTNLPLNTKLEISTLSNEGVFDFEFTSIKVDPVDGDIIGKTCKIQFNTPKCLDQCYSCNQTGNDEFHYCYGCKNESYFINYTIDKNASGFGELHNCYRCDNSCLTCKGSFIPEVTTNCKKCFTENGYYPYEKDDSICINDDTQDYWEEVFDVGIYLDKPSDDNETWVWRNCHENCRKCFEKGNKFDNKCYFCRKNYSFFCNQTVGNGIPGSCYYTDLYADNGFYTVKKENRDKLCPCLNHCKKCQDDPNKCNKCFKGWFLTLEHDSCDETCGYCLAEDTNIDECVNCAKNGTYTLNKTCVATLEIDEKTKNETSKKYQNEIIYLEKYHVIDETCKLLTACFGGCQTCQPWFSDNCISCKENFYKEDFFGKTEEKTFHCFSKDECHAEVDYKYNESIRPGGVAIRENEQNVCLNCKLRNESYRQPSPKFYCGTKGDRTYIDIEDYNKLSECYKRCKTCDIEGFEFKMNCLSCRDSKYYELFKYDVKTYYGNCYRKAHKCGIYPYYHDYDIAPFVNRTDDDCGEDCDVCLYNFSCTENYPYFVYETHECVEYCPITEVFGEKCNMNHSAALIILLRNPFGLKNPYDFLNTSITISQFIQSSFFQYLAQSYNLDVGAINDQLNGMFGNGQIYHLNSPRVIAGNNITIELTTFKLELEKIEKWLKGEDDGTSSGSSTGSAIDLSQCEAILKKKYGLSEEEELMIIKGDTLKEFNDILGTSVEYQIFSTSLGAFLPLNDCQEGGATVTVTNPFNTQNLITQFQSKTGSVVVNGYNVFDVNSPFYNDICTDFTNENGNDVLLDDRRKDYFNENINLCETGCKFVGYNISTNLYTCICNIKPVPGVEAEEYTGDIVTYEMPKDFRDLISKRSNIEVFKCASQVFSSKGQKKNFGSYILLTGLASLIGIIVFHFVKEKGKMDSLFNQLARIPNRIANPPKPVGTQDDKKTDKKNSGAKDKKQKIPDNSIKVRETVNLATSKRNVNNNDEKIKPIRNVQKDLFLTEDQLNFAEYNIAFKQDHRAFIKYYWSLLKMKQLFVFTFYTSDDFILRTTKIALFILFIGFYLTFTALFFNDSIMRAIYIYKGNTNAAVHIPNIILSSLCCLVASLIVRFVSLNEREISKITQLNNEKERRQLADKMKSISKVKLIVMYAISGALLFLFWYYVSAFCAVFKNSQGHYFTNVLVAFILCNLWPCVISLIPALLRKKALDNGNETLYKVSQIISYF